MPYKLEDGLDLAIINEYTGVLTKSHAFFEHHFMKLSKKAKDRLDYLDLAKGHEEGLSEEEQTGRIIRSLKENYLTYGLKMVSKGNERFFLIPRVPLPPMKEDSTYKVWQSFVNKVAVFFDDLNRKAFIDELSQLQKKYAASSHPTSSSDRFEQILFEFEHASGFSSVIEIPSKEQEDGLLSTEQFKKILSQGHPFNDFGASSHHGKLSHRLQFHILGNYFLKNVEAFFSPEDLKTLIDSLTIQYPEHLDEQGVYPVSKIISAFYRLLGSEDFNECFDWNVFIKKREELNLKFNKKNIPEQFNQTDIWVQLFDRYGYAGLFSVPSTMGLLQKLGCFRALPTIGIPDIASKKDLQIIMDVTPKFRPNP